MKRIQQDKAIDYCNGRVLFNFLFRVNVCGLFGWLLLVTNAFIAVIRKNKQMDTTTQNPVHFLGGSITDPFFGRVV